MKKHDRDALKLALEQARGESAGRAQQIDSMLKDRDRSWESVASFASSCCQSRNLKLDPWDRPPCRVSEDDDDEINADAVQLLREMLAVGVSRYAPDPLTALAEPVTPLALGKTP